MTNESLPIFISDHLSNTMGLTDQSFFMDILREYILHLDSALMKVCSPSITEKDLFAETHKLKSSSSAVGTARLTQFLVSSDFSAQGVLDHKNLVRALVLLIEEAKHGVSLHLASLERLEASSPLLTQT